MAKGLNSLMAAKNGQPGSSRDVVRNTSRMLENGLHSPIDPIFDVGFGTFYPKKIRQA